MSARDDYPALVVDDFPFAEAVRQADLALSEIDRLRRWKAEAECVIQEWDRLWEDTGRPGRLGETKAAGLRAALQEERYIL